MLLKLTFHEFLMPINLYDTIGGSLFSHSHEIEIKFCLAKSQRLSK